MPKKELHGVKNVSSETYLCCHPLRSNCATPPPSVYFKNYLHMMNALGHLPRTKETQEAYYVSCTSRIEHGY